MIMLNRLFILNGRQGHSADWTCITIPFWYIDGTKHQFHLRTIHFSTYILKNKKQFMCSDLSIDCLQRYIRLLQNFRWPNRYLLQRCVFYCRVHLWPYLHRRKICSCVFYFAVDLMQACNGFGVLFTFPAGLLVKKFGVRMVALLGAVLSSAGYSCIWLATIYTEVHSSYYVLLDVYFVIAGNETN